MAWGAGLAIHTVGRRRWPALVLLDESCRLPFVISAAAIAVLISLQDETSVPTGWVRASGIAVIAAVTWQSLPVTRVVLPRASEQHGTLPRTEPPEPGEDLSRGQADGEMVSPAGTSASALRPE